MAASAVSQRDMIMDDLAFAVLPLQYPVKLWVLWDERGMCRWMETRELLRVLEHPTQRQSLKEFSLEKQKLRSEFNYCLPLHEAGGGEKGHEKLFFEAEREILVVYSKR